MFRSLLSFVGGAALGAPFIILGYDAAREPGGRVKAAERMGLPQPELAVRLNGWAMVGAGIGLALGIRPRLMAGVLALSLIPTTAAGHAFWTVDEPAQRKGQVIHFLKNVGMLGGLILVLTRPARSHRRSR